ncbi:MAG: hypothetical protein M3Z64_01380 [Verrucomicrobiota bacterium]|nr:hypothetical protein [Verrucomicrobiota bacterium]
MDHPSRNDRFLAAGLAVLAGVLFYLSTKAVQGHFDYTFRIAQAMLRGHAGLSKPPPSWLNEMVPFGGKFYSVFPLGAVLVNLPVAILRRIHLIRDWPGRAVAATIAGGCVYFAFLLSFVREMSRPRRVLLALFPVFATWTWSNLGLGGAWQVALGFALLGQLAALYFTLVRPRPLLAGVWLAIACGNRVELFLTWPLFACLWLSNPAPTDDTETPPPFDLRQKLNLIARFAVAPVLLVLATCAYNYARFGSPADFGYARIPKVLSEPWYRHGLFSPYAIPWNAFQMLFHGLADEAQFPFLRAEPFGCSIFVASPFLFLLFREGGRFRAVCWTAIGALTLVLWLHGNPGGWQFSYRYAMILLPWMLLLLLENGPRKLTAAETSLFVFSVMNGLAVYEFLWANIVRL